MAKRPFKVFEICDWALHNAGKSLERVAHNLEVSTGESYFLCFTLNIKSVLMKRLTACLPQLMKSEEIHDNFCLFNNIDCDFNLKNVASNSALDFVPVFV